MRVHEIGRHTLTYGDDGVSVMVYRGSVSLEEMELILATEDLSNVPEVVLLICDMREFGKIDPAARRLGAKSPKPARRYFTAYIGAGFADRIMIDMWNRAINLLQGDKYRPGFFNDHASARAWLLAQRAAFLRDRAA